MEHAGFELLPGETPIVPVMLHEATRAQEMAAALDERGVYVAGFFYPVVPKGRARIRTQMSAGLTETDVDFAVQAFTRCRPRPKDHLMRNDMKALVKAKAEPGLALQNEPVPEIGPDEILVKVAKTGICGTDIHIWNWDAWAQKTIPVPMIVGHEYSGKIVEVGSSVRGLEVGQRVSGEGHVIGMRSRAARGGRYHLDPETRGIGVNIPGAFADYVKIPAFNAVPLPDDVDDELGAILDPLGNAVHTALSFDLVGEDVLVTGAGPIGIMAAAVARHVGARHVVITDINPYRLALAGRVADVRPVNVAEEDLKSVMHGARHARGLRRGAGDERRGGGAEPDARYHHHRRQDRHARHSRAAVPGRLDQDRLSHADASKASTAGKCSRPGTR